MNKLTGGYNYKKLKSGGDLIMIEYSTLNEDFIIQRFPELKKQVEEEMEGLDEFLPHAVFVNVFNPFVVKLLKQDDYKTNSTLKRIFEMYENLSSNGDFETQNLVQVTLLEYLWDEKITYERSMELMGEKTRVTWDNIYSYISVPKE